MIKLVDILKQLAHDALADDPAAELVKTARTVKDVVREGMKEDQGPLRRLQAEREKTLPAPAPFDTVAEEKTEAHSD